MPREHLTVYIFLSLAFSRGELVRSLVETSRCLMVNSRRKISGPCRSYQITAKRIARGGLIFVWNLP